MQRAVRNLRMFHLWPRVHIENKCYFCCYKYDSITVSQSNTIISHILINFNVSAYKNMS